MTRGVVGVAIGLAFALAHVHAQAAEEQFEYVGAKKCRTCHKKELIGNQYAWWEDSEHAKAFETLGSEKALEYAREKGIQGSPQEADECLKCHVTALGVPDEMVSKRFDRSAGVQCEACHGAGKGYRKKKIMSDRDRAVAKGLVEQSEEVCVTCHNDESPAWDPNAYVLADGSSAGFDYEQAKAKIEHAIPPDVKGKYIELEMEERAAGKARGESDEDEEEEE
jgi:hypothetical protein